MKECWINVYYNGKHPPIYGQSFSDRELAICCSKTTEPIYRIHVRFK